MSTCSLSGGPLRSDGMRTEMDGRSVRLRVESHGSKLRYLPNTAPTLYDVHSFPKTTFWKSDATLSLGDPP